MEIIVKNADIQRELNLLEKLITQKPTIQVLANVHILASMGSLILSATDLEVGLVGVCSADVIEPGAITLPAKKLIALVRAQSSEEITFKSATGGHVKFSSGGFSSRLSSLPPQDLPKMPDMDGLDTSTLPRDSFGGMLAQVRYAIADASARYYMNGACLKLKEDKLTLASTDGHRISVTECDYEGSVLDGVLIPSKAVDELIVLCGETSPDPCLEFARSDRHLFFNVDGRLLISRMIDGQFPNYERMIPKDHLHKAHVDREHLALALKRVALIDSIVVVRLGREEGDAIQLWSASAEVGDGSEGIPLVGYKGPPMELRFNAQYLLDFMTTALGEQVDIHIKDVNSPILLTDERYLNVIMGMRA